MVDAIDEIKVRARILQRRAEANDPDALRRLAGVREADEPAKRKHCLAAIGRELGFEGWQHAKRVLEGDPDETDAGTLLYPRRCSGFVNQWFADYDQARETRDRTGGYLLAYGRQYVVVERAFIETLGLDPDDADWEAFGRDWARPRDPAARRRLYGALVAGLR